MVTVQIGKIYRYKPMNKTRTCKPSYIDASTNDRSLDGMLVKVVSLKTSDNWVIGIFIKHNKYTKLRELRLATNWTFHMDQLVPLDNRINMIAIQPINTPGALLQGRLQK